MVGWYIIWEIKNTHTSCQGVLGGDILPFTATSWYACYIKCFWNIFFIAHTTVIHTRLSTSASPTQLCTFRAITYPEGHEQVKEPGLFLHSASPWQACRPVTAARAHSSISVKKRKAKHVLWTYYNRLNSHMWNSTSNMQSNTHTVHPLSHTQMLTNPGTLLRPSGNHGDSCTSTSQGY